MAKGGGPHIDHGDRDLPAVVKSAPAARLYLRRKNR